MSEQGPPNPLTKAAESSHLPRAMRARVGATTDPVPEGKVADTHAHHHFPIEPASHDADRAHAKSAEEMGLDPHEAEKLQKTGREHVTHRSALQSGMDWSGTASQANKKMPSTHRGADTGGKLSKGGGK